MEPFAPDAEFIEAADKLLMDSAVEMFLSQGMSQVDAEAAAEELLNSPAQFLLPTWDELGD